MGGLAVLFFIGLYIAGAIWLVRLRKTRRAKWIAAVIALLLPTTDAVLGRIYLQHLCNTEGGLKVYRVVKGVKGFMEQGATTDYWVKHYGYQFTEGPIPGGKYNRFSRQDGKIIQEWDVLKPKSKYRVKFVSKNQRGIYGQSVYMVDVIETGEVLALDTAIFFNGGWAERFLGAFSDAGAGPVAFCKGPLVNRRVNIVTNSLKH